MQLEQTLRTLCALPAVSGFEMQAAKAVAELFRPYCDTVDADKNGNVIGSQIGRASCRERVYVLV